MKYFLQKLKLRFSLKAFSFLEFTPPKNIYQKEKSMSLVNNFLTGLTDLRKDVCLLVILWVGFTLISAQENFPEFQIKRKEVFEFTKTPIVNVVSNNEVSVEFEVKDYCDVTIVIEDASGNIVRNLVSGVLGKNAPEPLQKDSLRQKVVWDKKNDQGKYIDNIDDFSLRVSLGLKPIFERTLFWSPYKRIGNNPPIFTASPEGVFVFEGHGTDSVRKYNHDGVYEKTIYPFPKATLKNVKGLNFDKFPQDGANLPIKNGPKHRSTLFVSGSNMDELGKHGAGAYSIAVKDKKIALVSNGTSRITTNGESSENGIIGPVTSLIGAGEGGKKLICKALSSAFSNDGKWLYTTGYLSGNLAQGHWLPVVMKTEYESQKEPTVFIGDVKPETSGSGDGQFKAPMSVAVDSKNNVLVADYMNDRIQVFSQEGKYLKSVKVNKPVYVDIHPTTGEIFVCSWMITNRFVPNAQYEIPAQYFRIKSIDDSTVLFQSELPLSGYSPRLPGSNDTANLHYKVCFDFWAKEPRIWVLQGNNTAYGGWGVATSRDDLKGTGITLYKEEGKALAKLKDFNELTTTEVVRGKPPVHRKQRMFVCPISGMLYIAEGDSGVNKSFKQLVSVNPKTNETKIINLPFTAEDACIDLNGFFCLRTEYHIVRYDPKDWREIPFDYGIEHDKVGFDQNSGTGKVISAIELPATGKGSAWWHLGGMSVSPNGDIVASCFNHAEGKLTGGGDENPYAKGGQKSKVQKYMPSQFPGRMVDWEIHVWDKFGKPKFLDAFSGVNVTDGIHMDKNDNLYVLMQQNRMFGKKTYFLPWAETLVKVKAGNAKVISESKNIPLPIAGDAVPKRDQEVAGAWIENVDWLYGGVGFNGNKSGGSCICWNARPALDLLARSFAPEVDHFSVAVLDTNGNLILRVGQYGNVDDGKPLVAEGGPKNTTSIGGDEVALFHAPYVATLSDKKLFISDGGNSRIVSVKLDYHVNHNTKLKK